jgi:hypothetical protein
MSTKSFYFLFHVMITSEYVFVDDDVQIFTTNLLQLSLNMFHENHIFIYFFKSRPTDPLLVTLGRQ